MRPQHLLRRTTTDRYPSNVICLACDCVWEQAHGGICSETARLVRWVAVGFSGTAGSYGPDHWAEGVTADEWWQALGNHLARRGATVILCQSAGVVCSLLDLWAAVEGGQVDLGGADERDARGPGHNGQRKANMRCVLECPPVVVEGKVRGFGSGFKILDAANYGLQPDPEGTGARASAARLSRFARNMVGALRDRQLGSLKDTAGSQAAASFKRRHLTHLMQAHNDERALNLEGESYYGGRCEAFRIGRVGGPVYHLDVSAMYPFCARNNYVPVSLSGVDCGLGAGDQPQLGEGCGLIADVTVETDEPAYPYRNTADGITVWPVGVFRTVLSGPELQDALSRDRVIRWHRASWYHMAPALKSYAECTLALRDEHKYNPDMRAWAKALGVCLIGKFGQRERKWVDCHSNVFHGPWDSWYEKREGEQWTRYRSLANYVQREETGGWSYDALPAVASWVTSLARSRLLTMVRCAGWSEVYYLDTDALMVSKDGLCRLADAGWVRDGEPGFLRVKNVSESVDIHGVKAYDEEGRSVRLGRPLSVARGGPGGPRYWAHRTPAGACRERRPPQAVRVAVRHDRTEAYRHGLVCADGTVTPFQLSEG